MTTMPDCPGYVDPSEAMSPVILPLAPTRKPACETPAGAPIDNERLPANVARFVFPAIRLRRRKPALGPSLQAIWPKCECTETIEAGVELAKAVCRRLPARRPIVLALTSPGDGDGKTMLAQILAPELAKRAGGALAVDANFRNAGLTAQLTIPATSAPVDSSLIYPTDLAGLNVLPMSRQREFRGADPEWIEELRESWPLVLLDMASLEHAETAPLLSYCDGVCLVVRLGHTARRAVAEAVGVIAACGGRLLGCAVVGEST
jgi:Mrp family chromosome partitioning ATPase